MALVPLESWCASLGTLHIRSVVRYDYAYFGVTGATVSNALRVASDTCCAVAGLPGRSLVSDGGFSVAGQRGVMQGSFCEDASRLFATTVVLR